MKKKLVRAAFVAGLLSATASMALIAAPVAAAEKAPSVSRGVGKPLSEAQKLAQQGDFQGALAKVKEAQAVSDRTPFDDYTINEFLAFVSISLKDFPTAMTAYEAMAASPAEPAEQKQGTRHNLVLLTYQAKDYAKTVKYGQELEAMGPITDRIAAPLAQAYYFTNDYKHAQELAQKSVDAAVAAGKRPDRGMLSVLLSSQAKQNDQAGAAKTLELLASNYGDPNDWGQLIDVALGTAGIQNADGLDLYRLREAAGSMREGDDYTVMATLALQLGYPAEAKAALQQGIDAGKLSLKGKVADQMKTARQGVTADEKTLPAFARDAAKQASGEYSAKLAETYYGYGRYADAEAAARQAIAKGKMKDTTQASMVLGMAQFRQNKFADAEQTFNGISGASAARMKAAHLWALYSKFKAQPTVAEAPAGQEAAPAGDTTGQ